MYSWKISRAGRPPVSQRKATVFGNRLEPLWAVARRAALAWIVAGVTLVLAAARADCVLYQGFENCPLGEASLTVTDEGLWISGFGSGGEDGLMSRTYNREVLDAEKLIVAFGALEEPVQLGERSRIEALGRLAGSVGEEPVAILQCDGKDNDCDGVVELEIAAVCENGPAYYTIEIYSEEVLVASTDASTVEVTCSSDTVSHCPRLIHFEKRLSQLDAELRFGQTTTFEIPQLPGIVQGNRLRIIAREMEIEIEALTAFTYTASDKEPVLVTDEAAELADGRILADGFMHEKLGSAEIGIGESPCLGWADCDGRWIHACAMNGGLDDGVRMSWWGETPGGGESGNFTLEMSCELSGEPQPGASPRLLWTPRGLLRDGSDVREMGTCSITIIEEGVEKKKKIECDFAPIGSESYTLEVLLDGEVVYREGGRTGAAAVIPEGPIILKNCMWDEAFVHMWSRENGPQMVAVVGGPEVLGDEIAMIPEAPELSFSSYVSADAIAADAEELLIKEEKMAQEASQSGVDPVAATIGEPRMLIACPNPSRGSTEILFSQPDIRPLRVEIYDSHGRLVRALAGGSAKSVPWDWRGENGRTLPAGVYHGRCVFAGGSEPFRLIRVR